MVYHVFLPAYSPDGNYGDVLPDCRLRSECDAEDERVLHEPWEAAAQAGQEEDTETRDHCCGLHHQLVCIYVRILFSDTYNQECVTCTCTLAITRKGLLRGMSNMPCAKMTAVCVCIYASLD